MRIALAVFVGLVAAGCASGGSGGGDDRMATMSRAAAATANDVARTCVNGAIRNVGFTVVENDDDKLFVRGVRPRKEILGIPTSDDFDRIDAYIRTVSGRPTIQLELTTHDGTERDKVSSEVRRDGEAVLNACGA